MNTLHTSGKYIDYPQYIDMYNQYISIYKYNLHGNDEHLARTFQHCLIHCCMSGQASARGQAMINLSPLSCKGLWCLFSIPIFRFLWCCSNYIVVLVLVHCHRVFYVLNFSTVTCRSLTPQNKLNATQLIIKKQCELYLYDSVWLKY